MHASPDYKVRLLTPIERGQSQGDGPHSYAISMPPSLGLQEAAKLPASSLTFMPQILVPLVGIRTWGAVILNLDLNHCATSVELCPVSLCPVSLCPVSLLRLMTVHGIEVFITRILTYS